MCFIDNPLPTISIIKISWLNVHDNIYPWMQQLCSTLGRHREVAYLVRKSGFKAFLEQFSSFMNKHKKSVYYSYQKANMRVLFLAHKLININYYRK